mmetsp:Transcript_17070/g.15418  ORF Transcript_17070/g.15418 Transcript_17070/m.15418 type:complete len:348 (+) Transcript_17070:31-1074(+)
MINIIYILILNFTIFINANEILKKSFNEDSTAWTCITIQQTELVDGVIWTTENCTMDDPLIYPPLLTVNSISMDLTNIKVRAIPASADSIEQLQTVPEMANSNTNNNFIAGINGGYFWRVDISGIWIDDVCRGKTRSEALSDVSSDNVNNGIGDGLVKIDGEIKSNNCNCSGYSRPAILILDGQNSFIDVVYRGDSVDDSVQNAIAAGPNLVSYDASTQESYVDIPSDDDNINILEHAANTAVGLIVDKNTNLPNTLLLVTTDGSDECGPKDYTCGLNSKDLASLMKDKFGTSMAMSMDQGGSTTMWVKDANTDRDGVVSRSHNSEPAVDDGPRNVANGLFIEVLSN